MAAKAKANKTNRSAKKGTTRVSGTSGATKAAKPKSGAMAQTKRAAPAVRPVANKTRKKSNSGDLPPVATMLLYIFVLLCVVFAVQAFIVYR